MGSFKSFFVENWRSKVISLFIAFAIWYLIKSHLNSSKQEFPVPGTTPNTSLRSSSGTAIDDPILPLVPRIPTPLSVPVPGGGDN